MAGARLDSSAGMRKKSKPWSRNWESCLCTLEVYWNAERRRRLGGFQPLPLRDVLLFRNILCRNRCAAKAASFATVPSRLCIATSPVKSSTSSVGPRSRISQGPLGAEAEFGRSTSNKFLSETENRKRNLRGKFG